VKDWLFLAILVGLGPALIGALAGLVTLGAKGGARRLGRVLSVVAALYFSFTALFLLHHVVTWTGSSDGPGALFVYLFIAGSGLAALLCFGLALRSPPPE
jgi:hypothetical protein